jgi:serine phosphatase RsbU (regulator of sigma subunit)
MPGVEEERMAEELDGLRSKVAALEQLLEVYESAAVQQAQRLEDAMTQLEAKSDELLRAERERVDQMQRELEIARSIQTSILPPATVVRGVDIAAAMVTAATVGGDYYDVIPVDDGCWIGIGDVTGHGLDAGLVMLMTQGVVAALCRAGADSPRAVLRGVNSVLFDNIRCRLRRDDHVTFSLLRYHDDGRVVFAGAHEEILISRAKDRVIESIPTPGTWLGAMRDVGSVTSDTVLRLAEGDTMLLYTDGVTEAMNASREQYGLTRLSAELQRMRDKPVALIRDHLLGEVSRWADEQRDDATLLVLRRRPSEPPKA